MAREGGEGRARRIGMATRNGAVVGVALLVVSGAVAPLFTMAAGTSTAPRDLTIASPRPFFMQVGGQSPVMFGEYVYWTAINGQGQSGAQADRIYSYNIARHAVTVAVQSRFGNAGFIGGYAVAADKLAYVDTGFGAPGALAWRVAILDLRTERTATIATSGAVISSNIAPQIAFDGRRLLMLETADSGPSDHSSTASLYDLGTQRRQVLDRMTDRLFGDPTLAQGTALWTTIEYGQHASSHLTVYDLAHQSLRHDNVGDVSQLAASGDLVVWKSGMSGANGRIGLYSVSSHRVLATNLAGDDRAIFPTTDGHLVSWTYNDGSRVQIYSLGSGRVIYNTPAVDHRYYGLTTVANHAVAWSYSAIGSGKSASHGYIVVHQVR